jgi:hypothetical protein
MAFFYKEAAPTELKTDVLFPATDSLLIAHSATFQAFAGNMI